MVLVHRLCLLFFCLLIGGIDAGEAQMLGGEATERLRTRLESAGMPPRLYVGGEEIHATIALPSFYEKRGFVLAWSDNRGIRKDAQILIAQIQGAGGDGLNPEDYHLKRILKIREQIQNRGYDRPRSETGLWVDFDLLLTDAFMVYGSHLLSGRVNPETFDLEWLANRRGTDFSEVLQKALHTGQIRETLDDMRPSQAGYARLKHRLAYLRQLAQDGGWPKVPDGSKLEKGMSGERVEALRARLAKSGDIDVEDLSGDVFDNVVDVGVRKFQKRHGLEADGIVGSGTLKVLNLPLEHRLKQIEWNLERWRWLPQDLGSSHILVNIANFELDVIENEKPVMVMRVVVGRPYRRTPVFSDRMTYLVLNPYWNVPPTITFQDMLPQLRKNSAYFADKNIKVFQGWGADALEVDAKSVNWADISVKNFPYRFRQEPGPNNALGRVKFMFPNKFDVYLHDTSARDLFGHTNRSLSSGCIRVEKPIELATYLLKDQPKWSQEAIDGAIETRKEQTVRLTTAMPVHLLYWTAWADETGNIQFREDIYGRDKLLDQALQSHVPGSGL